MCECFGGEPVEFENLRSPEQQAMMNGLYHAILTGGQQGATQFPGQLSAPMTDMQKMAAKTMSGIGGFGWEQQSPKYKPVNNQYNPSNTWDLPVRGKAATTTTTNKTRGMQNGLKPYGVTSQPLGGLDPAMAAQVLASIFNFDPQNRRMG